MAKRKKKPLTKRKPRARKKPSIIERAIKEFEEKQKHAKPIERVEQPLLPYDVWRNWRPGIKRTPNISPEFEPRKARESIKHYVDRLYKQAGSGYSLRVFVIYFEPGVDLKKRTEYGKISKYTVDSFIRFASAIEGAQNGRVSRHQVSTDLLRKIQTGQYEGRIAADVDFTAILADVDANGDITDEPTKIYGEILWKT
jgi:hypothetical protein